MVFQSIALGCLVFFYGCYYLKMLLQKRQGIQTDQLGKGKSGRLRLIELLTKLTAIIVPAVELLSICLKWTAFPMPLRCLGAVLAAAGCLVFVISVVTMRDNWRAGVSETQQTSLVTGGIYAFSRNPAFLGFDLVYLGVLFMFFNAALLTVSLFAVVMFHLQIVWVEEPFLAQQFGDAYLQYQKRVNRYFGCKK